MCFLRSWLHFCTVGGTGDLPVFMPCTCIFKSMNASCISQCQTIGNINCKIRDQKDNPMFAGCRFFRCTQNVPSTPKNILGVPLYERVTLLCWNINNNNQRNNYNVILSYNHPLIQISWQVKTSSLNYSRKQHQRLP